MIDRSMRQQEAEELAALLRQEGYEVSTIESDQLGRHSIQVGGHGMFRSANDWIVYVEQKENAMTRRIRSGTAY